MKPNSKLATIDDLPRLSGHHQPQPERAGLWDVGLSNLGLDNLFSTNFSLALDPYVEYSIGDNCGDLSNPNDNGLGCVADPGSPRRSRVFNSTITIHSRSLLARTTRYQLFKSTLPHPRLPRTRHFLPLSRCLPAASASWVYSAGAGKRKLPHSSRIIKPPN